MQTHSKTEKNMQFDCYTRYKLLQLLLPECKLTYDYTDAHGKEPGYILSKNIIENAYYCLHEQYKKYKKLNNNEFNSLVHYVLSEIKISTIYDNNIRKELINWLKTEKVDKKHITENIICYDYPVAINLYILCKHFIDGERARKNKNAYENDNDIAEDNYIFEQIIVKIANDIINELGNGKVYHRLSNRQGLGQKLEADVVIYYHGKHTIFDAKFYKNNFIEEEKDNKTEEIKRFYKPTHNRNQMCTYMTQLKGNYPNELVTGVVIHAADETNYIQLEEKYMGVANNEILLEQIRIDTSADQIIQDIQNLLYQYIL